MLDAGLDVPRLVDTGIDAPPPAHDSAAGCTGGFDAGPDASCGSATDPRNCGTCGHDCDGGACRAGSCVPMPAGVLATGQNSGAASIQSDGTSVYWLNIGPFSGPGGKAGGHFIDGEVSKCAAAGCNNTPLVLASGWTQGGAFYVTPSALALGADAVYWAGGGDVMSCGLGGCACNPSLITASMDPTGIVVATGRAYWTEYDVGLVVDCPTTGCSSAPSMIAGGQVGPIGMTADADYVYWTNYGGSVMRCALPSCAGGPTLVWRATLGSLDAQPTGIAVDDVNLYWTNAQPSPDGSVLQCAKSNCQKTVVRLASSRGTPWALATDATDVYWTEGNAVYRCAIGGCGGTPTEIGPSAGLGIAVDATNVYVSTMDPDFGWEIAVIAK